MLKPWFLVVLILTFIVYGSLYPFSFRIEPGEADTLTHLLNTWQQPPGSRGSALANIVFYVPLGFALALALGSHLRAAGLIATCVFVGGCLSATMELAQYYDAGRDSSMSDVYLNSVGALIGGLIGVWWRTQGKRFELFGPGGSVFVLLVLLAWLGWRLFPFEPVIDLHKYWSSVKPVFLTPSFSPYDIFRDTMMWTAVGYLAPSGLKLRHPALTVPLGILGVLAAKMLIIDQIITLPEVAGGAFAILYLRFVFQGQSLRSVQILAGLFALSVVLEYLVPWQSSSTPNAFEWDPLFELLHAPPALLLQSLLRKVFLCGALFWLLVNAGLKIAWAAALEFVLLLAISAIQILLVNEHGQIIDCFMAVAIAALYLATSNRRLARSSDQIDVQSDPCR